jgi:replicative DNA helicase
MEAIRNVGRGDIRPKSYEVSKWMEEWDLRQAERKHRSEHPDDFVCVPTGLRSLDEIVKGVQQGELASVLATTNRGKSIFLTHIGYQAILRGFGVLHLSLEMNQFQVATRYDSRFSSIPYKKFKDFTFNEEDQDIIATRLKMSREKLSSKLRIISMPLRRCDINLVRQAVEEAREEMKIDMLIVDSGDHMNSIVKHKDKRLEAAEVYWDLKTIAEEERLAVWTSTQAGKEWATRKASSEAASESYDKARICDMILSLNAPEKKTRSSVVVDEEDDGAKESTPEEEDRPLKPYMELYLAKYRDGEAKLTFPLETDFAKMLFKEAKPSTTGGSFEDD